MSDNIELRGIAIKALGELRKASYDPMFSVVGKDKTYRDVRTYIHVQSATNSQLQELIDSQLQTIEALKLKLEGLYVGASPLQCDCKKGWDYGHSGIVDPTGDKS